jgi:hypothetical protein
MLPLNPEGAQPEGTTMNRHSSVKIKAKQPVEQPPPPASGLRKFFTRYVREEMALAAPASEVWRWFTAFDSFPDWNPFIRKAEGTLRIGSKLDIRLRLGERIISFRPEVTALDPAREVRWKTRVLLPGLFDVDRRFTIDSTSAQQTTFVQEETNSGLLVPIAYALAHMEEDLRTGFRDFSEALGLQAAATRQTPRQAGRVDAVAPNHAVQH